jgi:hypothetical protein
MGINLISLGQHNSVESDRCDSGRVVGNSELIAGPRPLTLVSRLIGT